MTTMTFMPSTELASCKLVAVSMVITSIRISGISLLQRMNYERAAEIGLCCEVALWKDGITIDM